MSAKPALRRPVLAAGLACGLLAGCSPSAAAPEAPTDPPNIVVLVTDDHRWDALGAAGNPIILTPALDALAGDGVRFRNAYVTTPICMTSRASILSGQYERMHGIDDFQTDFSPEAFAKTYPALLRSAGYWSGFIGKYGVGKTMPESEFDVWHGFPGQGQYETTDADGDAVHLTRLMGNQAVEFVQSAPRDRPFVLSVSFKAPHVQDGDPRQFIPDSAYLPYYEDVSIPARETGGREYFDALPAFLANDSTEARLRWGLRFATPEMYQQSVKNYYRLITQVDDVVGEIREAVRRRGEEDNTIIVFIGDNGFFLGEHGLAGKWYGYEESIRVPLIVYDPRVPKERSGRVLQQIALNVDVAPTVLSAAGIPLPQGMQGRSLLPLIRGEDVPWRDDFLFEHRFRHARIPRSDGVVTTRFKYLRYMDQEPVFEELFDLSRDPHETTNLALAPEHAEVLERMRARYAELAQRASGGGPPEVAQSAINE